MPPKRGRPKRNQQTTPEGHNEGPEPQNQVPEHQNQGPEPGT